MTMPTMATRVAGSHGRWTRCVVIGSLSITAWTMPSVGQAGSPGDDGLVIVDAGDPANRVNLLPLPIAGAAAEIVSVETFASSAVDDVTGEELGRFAASLDAQQTIVVMAVRSDGGFATRSRVDRAETDGDDELILGLDFTELVGMSWDSEISPDGVVVDSDLVDSGRLTETARSLTTGLATSLMALLPASPVGSGAHWTIEVDDVAGSFAYDCHLVSVDGGRFRVEFDYRIDTAGFEDDAEVRASTVGHGEFDGSLSTRLDGTTRLADSTTVTVDGDDVMVVTEYTMASVSRPLGAG